MDKRHAYFTTTLKTRDEPDGKKYIEGYFAVFGQETELWAGTYEQLAQSAFDNSLKSNDIRCLFNHDSGAVLGRIANKTLELRTDSHGLWGRVEINAADSMAADVYARVQRGDISGCSFGYTPITEEYEEKADGYHWTVRDVDLAEVSVCTFPAYPQTEIQARQKDHENLKIKKMGQRKAEITKKLEAIKC